MGKKKEVQKNQKFKERGVTLVALVITIIVLLILAGVALATLTGDSGILSNSDKAKENTIKANIKEKVQLAIMEHKIGQYAEGKTLKKYLEAAGATEVSASGRRGMMDGYAFMIVDGIVTVIKGELEDIKLGDVYTEMIGKEINYTTTKALANDVKWIVIGQDEDGKILATTNRPIGSETGEEEYQINLSEETWLTWVNDLDTKCAQLFAGSVQGEEVKVESIDIDHINEITGFEEPEEFTTYTFKNQTNNDFTNKIVNYYHPDADAANGWSKNETTYENNAYSYTQKDTGELVWSYEGSNNSQVEYNGTLKNMELILGPVGNRFLYGVASNSVMMASSTAGFCVFQVSNGSVMGELFLQIGSSSQCLSPISGSRAIRPIVYLSPEFIVEEQEDETYKLKEV